MSDFCAVLLFVGLWLANISIWSAFYRNLLLGDDLVLHFYVDKTVVVWIFFFNESETPPQNPCMCSPTYMAEKHV